MMTKKKAIERPDCIGPRINVLLQPEEETLSMPRPKNSRQLLEILGLAEETALVVRIGHIDAVDKNSHHGDAENSVYPELLTPDRRIWPGDEILVRKVGSTG